MSILGELDKKFNKRQASYLMVTILAMLETTSTDGVASVDDVVEYFKGFYQKREHYEKTPEKEKYIMARVSSMNDAQVKSTLLKKPVNYLPDIVEYDADREELRFSDRVKSDLDEGTKRELRNLAYKHLYHYYEGLDPHQLKLQELDDLSPGVAVTAADVAALSGHNQAKDIHPMDKEGHKAVIILAAIGGENYQWLDAEKSILKYYPEGKTDRQTGKRTYNLESHTNKLIMDFREKGYPVYVFAREEKGELFHFAGAFSYERVVKEESGDYYFILKGKEGEKPMGIPGVLKVKEGYGKDAPSNSELVDNIYNYITTKGFVFEENLVKNFYLSLKTKPFVILAGISGTGKSKLVELFAEAVGATGDNGRFKLIPVRPDWNDSSDLLGYKNLEGKFLPGPLTKVIQEAIKEKDRPYFVCLDEMNLARVEYYFSDFLSLLETRKLQGEELRSNRLFNETDFPLEEDKEEFSGLYIPENLFIVGTVNMDETTHPFSKKVLDRANTIEFTDVYLDNFNSSVEEVVSQEASNTAFINEYCFLKDCLAGFEETVQKVVAELVQINEVLIQANLHVGYRVRDEICFYMIYNQRFDLLKWNEALDWQLLQKILPRIQGSSRQTCKVLNHLFEQATAVKLENEYEGNQEEAEKVLEDRNKIKWPRSTRKIAYMLGRYEEDGFTSFWA